MKITLCGSAKFEEDYKWWNRELSLRGNIVYSLAVYPSDAGEKNWYTPDQKLMLDGVHLGKIQHSDAIVVLNIDGYIGDSTKKEIEYAQQLGKQVYWVETDPDRTGMLSAGSLLIP